MARGRPRKVKAERPAEKTRAEQIIWWIERVCRVPEGIDVGKPVVLRGWQRDEIIKIYDNPVGTRRAIISFGRKNAKSSLAAMLLLVHLCGPEAPKRPNSQLYSAARSRDQASLIFNLAAKMVRMSIDMRDVVAIRDAKKELYVPELGITYRALSAEATTAYGLSPALTIHDELGLVRGPRDELYEALETATGAQSDPLSIIISTQAASDGDLLSLLIDDAVARHDPHVTCSLYSAPKDADPFAEDTVRLANPAFGDFLNAKEVMAMAEDARRMPAREAEFRNLVLNQRVELHNPFISQGLWKECGGEVADLRGRPVFAGLDLSSVSDLTALVLIGQVDGIWHIEPTFWLPQVGLREKAEKDHVPYDLWAAQGYLQTTPSATVSYEYVARYLATKVFKQYDVRKVAFDRWRMQYLKPWIIEATGMGDFWFSEMFYEFGQGTQSMTPALRVLEEAIRDHRIRHNDHPVMNMCAINAVVDSRDESKRKLAKEKSTGRIDGMVALCMAAGVAPLAQRQVDVRALIG